MAWVVRMAPAVRRVLAGRKDQACRKAQACHKDLEPRKGPERHEDQGHRHRAQTSAHTRQVVHHVVLGDREIQVPAAVARAEVAPDVAALAVEGAAAAAAEAAAVVASGKPSLGALSMWTPGLPHCSSRHPGGTRKPAKEDTC